MKYWKKSNGEIGTKDDDAIVPDSVDVSESEYIAFANQQQDTTNDNSQSEYALIETDSERIEYIAKKTGLVRDGESDTKMDRARST